MGRPLSCGARLGEGQIQDLTVPGCLLETALVLERGQPVQLRVCLDKQTPMCIDLGIVRWAQEGNAGIEFIRMAGTISSGFVSMLVILKSARGQVPVGEKRPWRGLLGSVPWSVSWSRRSRSGRSPA